MEGTKTVTTNKKAFHEYFVVESIETGISLCGTEVKSIRKGSVNLKEAWCSVDDGEVIIKQMHISPYENGNIFNTDPLRVKRLLMHKNEIRKLEQQVALKGLTLIPLDIYLKNGRVKMNLGLCRGKKNYDKRDDIAKRDADREITRSLRRDAKSGY